MRTELHGRRSPYYRGTTVPLHNVRALLFGTLHVAPMHVKYSLILSIKIYTNVIQTAAVPCTVLPQHKSMQSRLAVEASKSPLYHEHPASKSPRIQYVFPSTTHIRFSLYAQHIHDIAASKHICSIGSNPQYNVIPLLQ